MYTVKNQKPGTEKELRILNEIACYFKEAKRILQKLEKSLKNLLTNSKIYGNINTTKDERRTKQMDKDAKRDTALAILAVAWLEGRL